MYKVGDSVTDNRTGDLWLIASIDPVSNFYNLERNLSRSATAHTRVSFSELLSNYSILDFYKLPKGMSEDKIQEWIGNSINTEKETNKHLGHEIIENYAGGKKFNYCRVCKVEV